MKLFAIISLLFLSLNISAQTKAVKLNEIMKTYHRFNMFDGSVLCLCWQAGSINVVYPHF
jgi:hypothetical protein